MKWLKTYKLRISELTFKVIISENGGIHASCLWYEAGRLLKAASQPGATTIHQEHRTDTTEKGVLEQIRDWATKKFDGPVEISDD